jgi:folate-dependent phosphoribosylglycinamide formyltransferase PurN
MKQHLKMNIALFTSDHLRHKYVAAKIADQLNLKLIVSESKSAAIEDTTAKNDEDKLLVANHFKERVASEMHFFGNYSKFPTKPVLMNVPNKAINSETILNALELHNIDVILLFGSSIIKPVLLSRYLHKVLNLHLGLSPYYKGSGTNFFPIVNNEFECIGATFHLASDEVDGGKLLHQFRLESIDEKDTIYSLGNKVILQAGEKYPEIAMRYLKGLVNPKTQQRIDTSKEYRIKDFTPETIKKAKAVLRAGGINEYLAKQEERNKLKPIFSDNNE